MGPERQRVDCILGEDWEDFQVRRSLARTARAALSWHFCVSLGSGSAFWVEGRGDGLLVLQDYQDLVGVLSIFHVCRGLRFFGGSTAFLLVSSPGGSVEGCGFGLLIQTETNSGRLDLVARLSCFLSPCYHSLRFI